MIQHGTSSLSNVTFREVRPLDSDTLAEDFPFKQSLLDLVRKAALSGVGITEWLGDDGQLPISQIPVEAGKTLSDYAHELYPTLTKVEALNMYLNSVSACYVEIPSFQHNRDFGSTPSKDKFITTLNQGIAKAWTPELKPAVEKRLMNAEDVNSFDVDEDSGAVQFPYVKLDRDRGGENKIVSPRTKLTLNQKKQNTVPLFLYKELINTIYEEAQSKLIRIHYRRTSGEVRVMDVTWSKEIISEIYGEPLALSYLAESYDGKFFDGENSKVHRGYVRVPSVGESKYGGIVRSINFSSIFKIEYEGIEADTSFVNINIPIVAGEFMAAVEILQRNQSDFAAMCRSVVPFEVSSSAILPTYEGAETWVTRTQAIEGTNFLKRLSLFMLANPQWFPKYSGGIDQEHRTVEAPSDTLGLL